MGEAEERGRGYSRAVGFIFVRASGRERRMLKWGIGKLGFYPSAAELFLHYFPFLRVHFLICKINCGINWVL